MTASELALRYGIEPETARGMLGVTFKHAIEAHRQRAREREHDPRLQ